MNSAESAKFQFFHATDSPPLAAALAALRDLPAPDPVAAVNMPVEERLAIVGEAAAAIGWAERLAAQRVVTVLTPSAATAGGGLPDESGFALISGKSIQLGGHLGAFQLSWVAEGQQQSGVFDTVLDLSPTPLLNRVELPPGYVAPGRDPLDQALAIIDLLAFDGEFEKPRYINVNERLCAHSRSQKAGCSNCIEVCATEAITGIGETVKLDPYLCQGCGTCSTVCPSGALSFQYPRVVDVGVAIKQQLKAYREAGGADASTPFHSAQARRKLLTAALRAGQPLPPTVIPVEIWSADSVGLDLLLGAVALGASRVAVLGAGSHDLAPLRLQASIGQSILNGMGFAGEYLQVVDAQSGDWLDNLGTREAVTALPPAEFQLLADKRTTLEFVIDHLIRHAPAAPESIALKVGAPFGSIAISDACTVCMSCVGACPAGALKAAPDAPRISFLERNCLQCGLCANTCPEQAISLTPQLLIKDRRAERVLREAEIFCCTACGKPMGAAPTIQNMLAKLSGHSMFSTPEALARLSMCGDCRVVDLIRKEDSLKASEITE